MMTRLDDALLVAAEATALAPRGHALGADPVPGGVRFGVWAPRARAVEVVIEGEPEHAHPLRAGTSGYHSAVVPGAAAGARYRFRLDGTDAYPDPLSRFQPDGPHGPSRDRSIWNRLDLLDLEDPQIDQPPVKAKQRVVVGAHLFR